MAECKCDTLDHIYKIEHKKRSFPVFLCPACREALELGRAVMEMPEGRMLFRSRSESYHSGEWLSANISPSDISGRVKGKGPTPLAALRGAKKGEGE
jgi:hypothetical protein